MVATKCTLLIASALPARKVEIRLIYLITYLSFDDGINILCNSRVIDQQSRVKNIKIVNCNFHNQITDHVTVLISEQFLEL